MTDGLRLTVLGSGYLGITHAACMASLGFDVLGVDTDGRKVDQLNAGRLPIYEPGLEELLRESDLVSLHPPLTKETRKLMGDENFTRMKPTAWLVNCSRGPIVDTEALVRALDAKRLAGCALDTVDPEPLPDPHPLRGREDVILNPHVAWYSEESMRGLQAGAPAEVRRVLSGEWPVNVVNRSVRGRNRAGL